jgi:hypothetical protein
VLPRVSAALSRFIAPVASTDAQLPSRRPPAPPALDAFRRETQHERAPSKDKPETPLRLVSSTPPSAENKVGSVALAFVQIFQMLRQGRGHLSRWLGNHSYQMAIRRQKKIGKFRKGTMLDQKAE